MKPSKFIIASIFASAVTALGTGAAYAAPGFQCSGFDHRGPERHHMLRTRDMGAVPPHFHRLGLTQAQRNSIFDIKYKSMPTLRHYYQQLRATRNALHQLSSSSGYDATKMRSLADQLGKLRADIAAQRSSDFHKIFAVLTPQQQAQFKQMRQMHRGHDAGYRHAFTQSGMSS